MPISDAGATAALTAMMGVHGAATTIHLFKTNVIPVPSSTPGSFTECTYDTYIPVASNAWEIAAQDDGTAHAVSPWFSTTKGADLTTAQSIFGGYLICSGPKCPTPQYLDGWRFDPPVPMRSKGNTLRFRLAVVAAMTDGSEGTALLLGTVVTASYETYKVRGLFRRRLRALARRLQALIDDEARRMAAADFDPNVPFDSVFVDGQADVAAGIVLARCQDLLAR